MSGSPPHSYVPYCSTTAEQVVYICVWGGGGIETPVNCAFNLHSIHLSIYLSICVQPIYHVDRQTTQHTAVGVLDLYLELLWIKKNLLLI